ncbi:bile acid:sodium symporter family protein [Allofournierella sp.]|uniref:bile acid:sodium symporter family protein n=1 Tax=Allofournierella sp. TaxID=1940256 RepID=UPI003AF1A912
METLKKVSKFVGKYMAFIVVAVAVLAFFVPASFLWVGKDWNFVTRLVSVNNLLMVVMFGMGLTLKLEDFKVVFTRPKDVVVGVAAQFLIMPLLAFLLVKVFSLPPELAVGVMLVGTCPGGTSSNVMTFLAKGDVALSVGMTACSTVLAPVLTPALTWLYLHETVTVDPVSMFTSIVKIVIVPIALGFLVNKFFGKFTQAAVEVLPLVSVAAIVTIVGAVVAPNQQKLFANGLLILGVVVLHNLLGYACGYGVGKALKLNDAKCSALSIEVGMQNSGLATSLAGTVFPDLALATVPGALFSVWHNISGSIVANLMAARAEKKAAEAQAAQPEAETAPAEA